MDGFEKILMNERGWISKWPERTVFICSGGMDSMVTIAKMIVERKMKIFPLFINRGQTNLEYERNALEFFEGYFQKHYEDLFHDLVEIFINIPPKELRAPLKNYSASFGHPLRNTILQMVGVQYAISLERDIKSVLCAQLDDDPFPHSKLSSLRATTIDVCQSLGEWDWQITSPNIDSLLSKAKTGKEEMIKWAHKHNFPIEETRSCYSGEKNHCGHCLACKRRKEAFIAAGLPDKTVYVE